MNKKFMIMGIVLVSSLAFGQVGVNTANPQNTFHIDGQKNNPATGLPSTAQQADDYIVTADGNVGIGVTAPTAKLQVRSGTNGVSGLKFDNINNTTVPAGSAALLGVDASGNVVAASANGATAGSTSGDVKNSFKTADHDGWYLLNGRAVSTLPAAAQAAATALGFTSNLPDATDRVMKAKTASENLAATGGINSLTIGQPNLPNVTFSGSISGTALAAGAHSHSPTAGNGFLVGGTNVGNNGTGNYQGTSNGTSWGGVGMVANTTSAANHTHTVNGTASVPSGGSGTALDNRSPYLVVNTYIYLGL